MATIEVKEIRCNGKKLRNVNDKALKTLIYGGNSYVIQNKVYLTVNTNNDYGDNAYWELDKGTYVSVSDIFEKVEANGNTIYAGSKSGYEFNGWSRSSFNIESNSTIDGLWSKIQTLLGSATINFIWYSASQQLVCKNISYSGEVGSSSVSQDDYWTCLVNEGVEFDVNFYNTSGSYIGTERFTFIPIEGDPDLTPSLTYNYYG